MREAAGDALAVTIFRPSVIFGAGDRFLNLFAQPRARLPGDPARAARDARFQPVWVEDVARCFADALGDPRAFGRDLRAVRARGLHARGARRASSRRRSASAARSWPLPDAAGQLQALVLEHLPGKLMTRDNLHSMSVDNVCAGPFPEVFGFQPAPLEAVVPEYLARREPARAATRDYRHYAGR